MEASFTDVFSQKQASVLHAELFFSVSLNIDEKMTDFVKKQAEFLSACIVAGQPRRLGHVLKEFLDEFNFVPLGHIKSKHTFRFLRANHVVYRVKDARVVEVFLPPEDLSVH